VPVALDRATRSNSFSTTLHDIAEEVVASRELPEVDLGPKPSTSE